MNSVHFEIKELREILRKLEGIEQMLLDPKTDPGRTWLDSQEVMELLKISPRTLVSYRQTGILKYSKMGNKIYYRLSEILESLDNNEKRK